MNKAIQLAFIPAAAIAIAVVAFPPLMLFDRYVVQYTQFNLPYPANEGECFTAKAQWPRYGVVMYSGSVLVAPPAKMASAQFDNGAWHQVDSCEK
jgi:hypothetical protein